MHHRSDPRGGVPRAQDRWCCGLRSRNDQRDDAATRPPDTELGRPGDCRTGRVHRSLLDRDLTLFSGANADYFIYGRDPDLAVTDLAGTGGVGDHGHDFVGALVGHEDLDLDLEHEVDRELFAAVDLAVAVLAGVPGGLADGHAADAVLGEGELY